MTKRVDQVLPGMVELVAGGVPEAEYLAQGPTGSPIPDRPNGPPTVRLEGGFDWRTVDPSTIQGEGIPVEELRFFGQKIDELLRDGAGQYVLIVGREIRFFPDIEAATRYAEGSFRGGPILIKKVVAMEPMHGTGGVVG